MDVVDWERMYRARIPTCEFATAEGYRCSRDQFVEDRPGFVETTHPLCRDHHGELVCQNVVRGYSLSRHMQCNRYAATGNVYCQRCQCQLYGCNEIVSVRRRVNGDCDSQDIHCEKHRDQMEWADPFDVGHSYTDKWCDVIIDAVRDRVLDLIRQYGEGKTVSLPFGFELEWDEDVTGAYWLQQEIECFNRWYRKVYPNSQTSLAHAVCLKDCREWLVSAVPRKYLFWLSLFARNGGFGNKCYQVDGSASSLSPNNVELHFGELTTRLATELTEPEDQSGSPSRVDQQVENDLTLT